MSAGCPMCGFDGSQVSPSDAATALRSYPRRFTAVLAGPDEDNGGGGGSGGGGGLDTSRSDDLVHRRPEGGGLSAIEHAAWVATGVGQIDEAFGAILYQNEPVISLPVIDPTPPVAGADDTSTTVVANIKAAGERLATAIDQAPRDGWDRSGQVGGPGGDRMTALEVVRVAVHLGVHHLRLAERTVAEVARQLG